MKPNHKLLLLILLSLTSISIVCIVAGLHTSKHISSCENDIRTQIDTLGKTHFILGNAHNALQNTPEKCHSKSKAPGAQDSPDQLALLLRSPDGSLKQALFSPDDDLETVLINLISAEQEALKIAVFSFTNGAIAQALVAAHQKGINIQLISDTSALKDRFNKLEWLADNGIKSLVYRPSSTTILSDIMHNKFVIFKRNVDNKSLLWTGSFNFTKSAQLKNQENVLILDEPYLIDKYDKQFEVIKQRISQTPKMKLARQKHRMKNLPLNSTVLA